MEIKDNQLLRQFENQTEHGLLIMEYAIQERKLFLTKLKHSESIDAEYVNVFIETILNLAQERKLKVVPTHPKVASMFRKNPVFREMLPPGIKL
ncbi:MAG: GNAT family N-acetyltransferase [Flavobacterium sp.]